MELRGRVEIINTGYVVGGVQITVITTCLQKTSNKLGRFTNAM